jgi:hypothetical protein
VEYYEDPSGPEARQRILMEIAGDQRQRAQQQLAVPALTGNSLEDLANARDAVIALESQWDEADLQWRIARSQATPFAPAEAWMEAARAEQARSRCWALYEQSRMNRDHLEALEDRSRDLPYLDGEWR